MRHLFKVWRESVPDSESGQKTTRRHEWAPPYYLDRFTVCSIIDRQKKVTRQNNDLNKIEKGKKRWDDNGRETGTFLVKKMPEREAALPATRDCCVLLTHRIRRKAIRCDLASFFFKKKKDSFSTHLERVGIAERRRRRRSSRLDVKQATKQIGKKPYSLDRSTRRRERLEHPCLFLPLVSVPVYSFYSLPRLCVLRRLSV